MKKEKDNRGSNAREGTRGKENPTRTPGIPGVLVGFSFPRVPSLALLPLLSFSFFIRSFSFQYSANPAPSHLLTRDLFLEKSIKRRHSVLIQVPEHQESSPWNI